MARKGREKWGEGRKFQVQSNNPPERTIPPRLMKRSFIWLITWGPGVSTGMSDKGVGIMLVVELEELLWECELE